MTAFPNLTPVRLWRAAVALVLLTAVSLIAPPPAGATRTTLCNHYSGCGSAGFGNDGYAAASGTSYWGMHPGHNCTNYAAYRLIRNGANASYLQGNGNAHQWGGQARSHGVTVNSTPAVGAIAWWDSNSGGAGSLGHVAYVEAVSSGYVLLSEDNHGGTFHWIRLTPGGPQPTAYLHFKDLTGPPGSSPSAPAAPGPIAALVHGSRVNLSWGASAGASDYQVFRDGNLIATTTGTTFLDTQVAPRQAYTYTVTARNGSGTSGVTRYAAQTTSEAADRATLATKDGPASCGRAGGQNWQTVTCSMLKSTGWTSIPSPAGDWGYTAERTWLTNADGTVSYCRRVGNGDLARCDRFDGTAWTHSISPQYDLGYPENRAFLTASGHEKIRMGGQFGPDRRTRKLRIDGPEISGRRA